MRVEKWNKNLLLQRRKRLDVYLAAALDVSRSYAQQLIQGEDVVVNDKQAKSNYRLSEGDVVCAPLDVQEEYNVGLRISPSMSFMRIRTSSSSIRREAWSSIRQPEILTGHWSMPCSTTVRENAGINGVAQAGHRSSFGQGYVRSHGRG